MPFTAPSYPAALTKANWDKKKGAVAKMAGETGVGDAATKAAAEFGKIDWTEFDVEARAPQGRTAKAVAGMDDVKANLVAEYNKTVKPTIAALLALNKAAEQAVAAFRKNKLVPKDSVKLAEGYADGAKDLAASLALNGSILSPVLSQLDATKAEKAAGLKQLNDNATGNLNKALVDLLKGLSAFKADPTMVFWNKAVQPHGRSVSNGLKVHGTAGVHLKTWTSGFQGFDWKHMPFSDETADAEGRKAAIATFIGQVAGEVQKVRADLAKTA